MQILFLVLGLILTFFGVKWTFKSFKGKEIIGFPLSELKKEFEIIKPGLFTLCVVGGGYVDNSGNFRTLVMRKDNQKIIELKENILKPRFRKNRKMGVEYLQFKISHVGLYKVEIENAEDLVVKKSMLKTKQVFQSPLSVEKIEISIKETIPISKKLFGIIFLVLGVNMSAWGIMLEVNPELFG